MKKMTVKFQNKKQTMHRKLFLYMVTLAAMLLIALLLCLFAFGQISSTSEKYSDILNLQTEVFEREITSYYNDIAVRCARLSENIAAQTNEYFRANGISFGNLENSPEHIKALESEYMHLAEEGLLQTGCSGAFVVLDTSQGIGDKNSRAGIYLQRNIYGTDSGDKLLLYRGNAQAAKQLGIAPHRKWSLEFHTEMFPDFREAVSNNTQPLERACRINGITVLPETSEKVMIVSIPIRGEDGITYGICGYEISASAFKAAHAQPTTLSHLLCVFSKNTDDKTVNVNEGFSCGVAGGYYKPPKDILNITKFSGGNGLISLTNEHGSYIGITKEISIYYDDAEYEITAMVPKSDYTHSRTKDILKIILVTLVLGFAVISGSMYFSKRYIVPIMKGLEKIKQSEHDGAKSDICEIDDLFDFLSAKDRENELLLDKLTKEQEQAENEIARIQTEFDKLAYNRKKEVHPDDYEYFRQSLIQLTKTEKIIFEMYLDGKKSDDIMAAMNIKPSTLKYHNHNIYEKLGVTSRKQLIQLAALWERDKGNK